MKLLTPYIWPTDRADLKLRVVLAIVLMIASKFVTIATPYAFKYATDALAHAPDGRHSLLPAALTGMFALTALYGVLRILMALTQQGRDALFAAVAMNAVRRLAIEVFVHLHRLSLRFHLERKTGGLTRVLERGRTAIETIIRTVDADGGPDSGRVRADHRRVSHHLRLALCRGADRDRSRSISCSRRSRPTGASRSAAR